MAIRPCCSTAAALLYGCCTAVLHVWRLGRGGRGWRWGGWMRWAPYPLMTVNPAAAVVGAAAKGGDPLMIVAMALATAAAACGNGLAASAPRLAHKGRSWRPCRGWWTGTCTPPDASTVLAAAAAPAIGGIGRAGGPGAGGAWPGVIPGQLPGTAPDRATDQSDGGSGCCCCSCCCGRRLRVGRRC